MIENKILTLPDELIEAKMTAPRDLMILSIPKMGKGTILGDFTKQRNAIVLDIEKGGYEYITARKLSTYISQDTTRWESFQNYLKYRKLLLENRGKYEYLIIDGLSDLDDLSEIGGTLAYMDSNLGKNFNRRGKDKIEFEDSEWKSVLTLASSDSTYNPGYKWTRDWLLQQVELFKLISPYRIYAAHVADKFIKDRGKEEVIGSEISITGKLKTILASKVTALAKMIADGNKRYLNFEVLNDSIVAGSRAPFLKGLILISEMNEDGNLKTYWENIYKQIKVNEE